MSPQPCAWLKCEKGIGTFFPVLNLYPMGQPHWPEPSRLVIGAMFCRPCGEALTVEDLVTDETWRFIVADHVRVGRHAPDRATVLVTLAEIDDPDVQLMLEQRNEMIRRRAEEGL